MHDEIHDGVETGHRLQLSTSLVRKPAWKDQELNIHRTPLTDFAGSAKLHGLTHPVRKRAPDPLHAYRDQYATLFKNGRGVVLIAISADPDTALASWARDSEFPFLFASDSGTVVARRYGALASQPGPTNRNLVVVGPDGRIAYRAIPFQEIDPSAYKALGAAVEGSR